MVNINKKVAKRIRQIRKEKKLTQEEVAYRAELDYSYYNQIENARRNPSVEALERIARALGVNIKRLF